MDLLAVSLRRKPPLPDRKGGSVDGQTRELPSLSADLGPVLEVVVRVVAVLAVPDLVRGGPALTPLLHPEAHPVRVRGAPLAATSTSAAAVYTVVFGLAGSPLAQLEQQGG